MAQGSVLLLTPVQLVCHRSEKTVSVAPNLFELQPKTSKLHPELNKI